MKILSLVALVLVLARCSSQQGPPASMVSGVTIPTAAFERFMDATDNGGSCRSCGCTACCPVIVRNCAPRFVGSVIEAYLDWRGNAAIIVDWGCTEYNPCGCCSKGRLCTLHVDIGYVWYIDWGDGSSDSDYPSHLGPIHVTHQYDRNCRSCTYEVTIYYCSNPGCPDERCCDSISQIINVSEDPTVDNDNDDDDDYDYDGPSNSPN